MDSINFEIINNKRVFSILSEPDTTSKRIVIMSHGFRGTSIGPARTFVDFAHVLVNNGISVLRFDQPNGGNSEGDYINSSFNEWVATTSYFAKKYLDKGYKVALLGQSMGASTSVIASNNPLLEGKITALLLWVPDPKSTFDGEIDKVYEEGGQQYKGSFWQEAKESNFFGCLDNFKGKIHLVYGDHDKYISEDLRNKVIDAIENKGQQVMILSNQDHSPWDYDICQKVYNEELELLKNAF